MIAKPFSKLQPSRQADPTHRAGWDAEQDAAFRLDRAFGDPARKDIRVFHDIRLPATFASGATVEGDYFQIDHLVLHRHGTALIESKSVYGDLHVDELGQWQRRSASRSTNIASPVTQVNQQAAALLRLFQSAVPPLLNKMFGLAQPGFASFPATPFVAIANNGRLTGATGPYEAIVMKVDRVVEAVSAEIDRHRRSAGVLGLLRGAVTRDSSDAGIFDLKPEEMDRIERFLLARHTPLFQATAAPSAAPAPPTSAAPQRGARIARLESLACGKCGSANVRIIYARDYCLTCDACGRFSPLPYVCPLCGKHATIRKNGADHFRECDGEAGCGVQTVFWQSSAIPPPRRT